MVVCAGITTVSVNLVDGQGHEVKLLHCPPPVRVNSGSAADVREFPRMTETKIHERVHSRPG